MLLSHGCPIKNETREAELSSASLRFQALPQEVLRFEPFRETDEEVLPVFVPLKFYDPDQQQLRGAAESDIM